MFVRSFIWGLICTTAITNISIITMNRSGKWDPSRLLSMFSRRFEHLNILMELRKSEWRSVEASTRNVIPANSLVAYCPAPRYQYATLYLVTGASDGGAPLRGKGSGCIDSFKSKNLRFIILSAIILFVLFEEFCPMVPNIYMFVAYLRSLPSERYVHFLSSYSSCQAFS